MFECMVRSAGLNGSWFAGLELLYAFTNHVISQILNIII